MSLIGRAVALFPHHHCDGETCVEKPTIKQSFNDNAEAVRYQLHIFGRAADSFDELAKQLKERRSK